jgi:predicted PhzF superfamily epimerase YddE/YHI9
MPEKDIEDIRDELIDYYGTAMMNGFPMAVMELSDIEDLSDEEVQALAEELGLIG